MSGGVSDFDHEGRCVLATHETGHQANAAACFHVHVSEVGGVDELVVHEDPGTLSGVGLLDKFGLCHHGFSVTGAVGNLDHEGRCVLATDEAGHQANAAACFQVHTSNVGCTDELVVHENPGTLGGVDLLGKFVLCHLNGRVSRCVCNFNFKFHRVVHVCSPLSE